MNKYKNGREAKEGDPIVGVNVADGKEIAGTLHSIVKGTPGNPAPETGNAQAFINVDGTQVSVTVTISECLHAADVKTPETEAEQEAAPEP